MRAVIKNLLEEGYEAMGGLSGLKKMIGGREEGKTTCSHSQNAVLKQLLLNNLTY